MIYEYYELQLGTAVWVGSPLGETISGCSSRTGRFEAEHFSEVVHWLFTVHRCRLRVEYIGDGLAFKLRPSQTSKQSLHTLLRFPPFGTWSLGGSLESGKSIFCCEALRVLKRSSIRSSFGASALGPPWGLHRESGRLPPCFI